MTTDFYFSGSVNNPKNFYDDRSWFTGAEHTEHVTYTYFEDQRPGSIDDCYGGSSAPQPLQDLKNYVKYVTDSPWGKACYFTPEKKYYMYYSKSWIFIRLAQPGSSRPIYGIEGVARSPYAERYEILLHNKGGEWIHAGSILGSDYYVNERLRPSGWSWDNVDAMLIGFWNPGSAGQLHYLGLLTKGSNVTFCKDGSANEYYRTVDDGKKCYWGVDCPTSGTGWTGKLSKGVGPFKYTDDSVDVNIGGCDCSSGDCDKGYCKSGNFCYSDVKCMNGGWNGTLTKCTGTCSSTGCG